MRGLIPEPDLQELEEKLQYFQRNIYKSFPYTRYGSSRDAFCYRRVSPHLAIFKVIKQLFLTLLKQACFHTSTLQILNPTCFVSKTFLVVKANRINCVNYFSESFWVITSVSLLASSFNTLPLCLESNSPKC